MRLTHGIHLAYCTNIHRGETWPETFAALQNYTLAVRDHISPERPYAIGLRLSDLASRELMVPAALNEFQRWLEDHHCYVFTINGFPFGRFHGARVKEQVYAPDWTTQERLEYTERLFDLLAILVPAGVEGSVSTVPGSFKEFVTTSEQAACLRQNLWACVEHIAKLSERSGKLLHLGLEPEPLCYLETSHETVAFIDQMRSDRAGDERIDRHLGVNYDTCHLAVEFEEPRSALQRFRDHRVRVSKLHLSSALKVVPTPTARQALASFADDIYFHQVIARNKAGQLARHRDLEIALAQASLPTEQPAEEWRIHFHVPLHHAPNQLFSTTADHLLGVLDVVGENPGLCTHLEMETYTWEVMPPELKNRSVVAQLVSEYEWTLEALARRGIVPL